MVFYSANTKNVPAAGGQSHPFLAPLIAAGFALGLLLVPVIHSAATGTSDIPPFDPGKYTAKELASSTLNDGIPDVWKTWYGLSVFDTTVANADYTSSGIMNREKYQLNIYPLATADTPAQATPAKKTSNSAKSATKDAPAAFTFTNGSFTNVTLGTNNNNKWVSGGAASYRDGKHGAFSWNYIDSTKGGKVDGWKAYKGNIIEIWKAGGRQFVELDATGAKDYGVSKDLTGITAGTYLMLWDEMGRSAGKVDGNAYTVMVGYGPHPAKAPKNNETVDNIIAHWNTDKALATNDWNHKAWSFSDHT